MKALLAAILAMFLLSGCAGLIAPFVNNPYAGTYTGTFATSDGKAGPATMNLTNIGNVFGNLTNTATGEAGTLNGSVDTHLAFNGTVVFGTTSHSVSGTFTSVSGKVTGKLDGSGGYFITVDVSKS